MVDLKAVISSGRYERCDTCGRYQGSDLGGRFEGCNFKG